jgi:hypothetical protein
MASTPKQNPWLGPLGILEPTTIEEIVEEIRKMDDEELLKWIQQKKPKLLRDEVLENFKKEYISGDVFLDHANDRKFFKEECNLPAGPSDGLAKLANEVIGEETIGTKSQSYLSRHARHADTS